MISTIIGFVGRNWKLLLILFGLGGTATVLSVVPGLDSVQEAVAGHVDSVKSKLVSATDVE